MKPEYTNYNDRSTVLFLKNDYLIVMDINSLIYKTGIYYEVKKIYEIAKINNMSYEREYNQYYKYKSEYGSGERGYIMTYKIPCIKLTKNIENISLEDYIIPNKSLVFIQTTYFNPKIVISYFSFDYTEKLMKFIGIEDYLDCIIYVGTDKDMFFSIKDIHDNVEIVLNSKKTEGIYYISNIDALDVYLEAVNRSWYTIAINEDYDIISVLVNQCCSIIDSLF